MPQQFRQFLPAQVNARYIQQQQIKALRATQCYQASVLLNTNSKEELQWWIQNLQFFNWRYLIQSQKFLTIRTDASKKDWRTVYQEISIGVEWNLQEQQLHINQGSRTSFASISQAFSNESYSFPNRQYNNLVLCCEDGENQKTSI